MAPIARNIETGELFVENFVVQGYADGCLSKGCTVPLRGKIKYRLGHLRNPKSMCIEFTQKDVWFTEDPDWHRKYINTIEVRYYDEDVIELDDAYTSDKFEGSIIIGGFDFPPPHTRKLTPSVYECFDANNKIIGYLIKVPCCVIGFDPFQIRCDEGFYDQYLIKINDSYIFGGSQFHYFDDEETIAIDYKLF